MGTAEEERYWVSSVRERPPLYEPEQLRRFLDMCKNVGIIPVLGWHFRDPDEVIEDGLAVLRAKDYVPHSDKPLYIGPFVVGDNGTTTQYEGFQLYGREGEVVHKSTTFGDIGVHAIHSAIIHGRIYPPDPNPQMR